MDLDPELAALRPLGGFFALRTTPRTKGNSDPARLPTLEEAYAPDAPGPDPLAVRVRAVGERLRTAEARVAASIGQQGLAARLWSVALGCAALYGRLPDLRPGLLRWDTAAAAPDDLWLTEVREEGPGDAAALADAVLHGHLGPLEKALRDRYGVAAGLLRGNAGSALAGAARELERWARAQGRTDVPTRTRALTAELFDHPLLRPTGTRTATAFRRRSCCLYYRVPGGGVCGDCCFTRPPNAP
ncbi:FhuF 2Fe-2S C-terminal domain-containing protein [Streptomyces misionensis]|uniref:FhuF 2Fe-2S C-terminal domain-containing protein n=1 Tax=Streptomyces misionensis TaxID=67331 RepID=A0A1H5FSB5_9ACTN|nr:(2Fe-2S)-binding protein [Streptomyces misionensis]SEE05768.1 FhuF 2Fe-2S C-terminal domain-containing protein [Streptomyces misionensis]